MLSALGELVTILSIKNHFSSNISTEFLIVWEITVKGMAKDSTKTSKLWKKGIEADGLVHDGRLLLEPYKGLPKSVTQTNILQETIFNYKLFSLISKNYLILIKCCNKLFSPISPYTTV